MNIRILQPEEYRLLDAIPEPYTAKLDPDNTLVAAAFDGEKIVGRLAALAIPHVEVAWIDPEYRNGTVAGRMHRVIEDRLTRMGAGKVCAFAVNREMEEYLIRLGYRYFSTVYEKEL